MTFRYDPAVELVVQCARVDLEQRHERRIEQLLNTDLDWSLVMSVADHNGVTPLLFHHLSNRKQATPSAVLDRLEKDFHDHSTRNLHMTGVLCRILDRFARLGIRAVPFKGPVLAAYAYENIGDRTFLDLDILVSRDDLSEAKTVMTDMGFDHMNAVPNVPDEQLVRGGTVLKSLPEYIFRRESDGVLVELRWTIERYMEPLVDFDTIWDARGQIDLAGRTVNALSPEHRLLVLSHHGTKHYWRRLEWICDLAETIRSGDFEWETVLAEARRLGCEADLYLGLAVCSSMLNVELPAIARERMDQRPDVASVARDIADSFHRAPNTAPNPFRGIVFDLKLTDEPGTLLWALARETFVPTWDDYAYLALPSSFHWLYYLVRPFRLAEKHGSRAVDTIGK